MDVTQWSNYLGNSRGRYLGTKPEGLG